MYASDDCDRASRLAVRPAVARGLLVDILGTGVMPAVPFVGTRDHPGPGGSGSGSGSNSGVVDTVSGGNSGSSNDISSGGSSSGDSVGTDSGADVIFGSDGSNSGSGIGSVSEDAGVPNGTLAAAADSESIPSLASTLEHRVLRQRLRVSLAVLRGDEEDLEAAYALQRLLEDSLAQVEWV